MNETEEETLIEIIWKQITKSNFFYSNIDKKKLSETIDKYLEEYEELIAERYNPRYQP